MLRKLLKYDIRATARSALLIFIILFAAASLSGFLFGLLETVDFRQNFGVEAIGYMLAFTLAFAAVAANVVAMVFVLIRYYTNFMTDEGYLSFTLPVTATEHMCSKLITVMLFSFMLLIVDALALFAATGLYAIVSKTATPEQFIDTFVSVVKTIWNYIVSAVQDVENGGAAFVVMMIVNLLASYFLLVFRAYFAMTIAGIAKRAKFIAGLGVFVGTTSVLNTVSFVATIVLMEFDSPVLTLVPQTAIYIAATVALFLITRSLMDKKLNLN